MAKFKLLCTKQIDPSLVERAGEKNFDIVIREFISVQPILTKQKADEVIAAIQAEKEYAAFTSAHAVAPFARYLRMNCTFYIPGWKIFCLSGKTGEEVKKHPDLGKIVATADNAASLATEIIRHGVKEIIFFCGSSRNDDLPLLLNQQGVVVHEVVMYETKETPVALTEAFDGILFFSPSAVRSFFSCNTLPSKTVLFAIGTTTASTIKDFTANEIIIASSPHPRLLLEAAENHFEQIPGK